MDLPDHNPSLDLPSSSSAASVSAAEQARRRAYKACLHCRSRKAKCDLGDIDSPRQPPCARCKRESRECVFAPSHRGGKIVRRQSTVKPDDANRYLSDEKGPSPPNSQQTPNVGTAAPFSASDLDIDVEADNDGRTLSDSEGPPRKIIRVNSANSDQETSDRGHINPQSLAAASLRNPTDALNLLALAADVDRKTKTKGKSKHRTSISDTEEGQAILAGSADVEVEGRGRAKAIDKERDRVHSGAARQHNAVGASLHRAPSLDKYALVKDKVVTPETLSQLVNYFFHHAHAVFPMVSHHRIPRDELSLAKFANEEEPLLTAIVVVSARQEKLFEIHTRAWGYMQTLINELILGKSASVAAVEALLLLSENLPQRQEPATEDEEHRMGWMLVGMAVRIGYMLGLDQKTLRPLTPGTEDDENNKTGVDGTMSENEKLDRDRLAWTYCYIFDRSISIRSGKAFWSRGPGLCFQRTHSGAIPSASETFPSLRAITGVQDDYSAMLQAYTELTQTMASAHDVLYPSKDRTIALVRVGDYHKYLDELTRSINGFRLNWEGKAWATAIVHECIWLTFHYTRLYIYAFAFQAHIQRSVSTAQDGKKVPETEIFPRGPMGSPDSRFILEAIDAATELLHMCIERLHPSGSMAYLPWRFFLYFQYAGVFLLKAVFVGAVVPQDQRAIVQLVKKVIVALACASSDDQHYGVRYARLLNGLLRVFSRGVDGVASQVGTPKRRSHDFLSSKVGLSGPFHSDNRTTAHRKGNGSHAASISETLFPAPPPSTPMAPTNRGTSRQRNVDSYEAEASLPPAPQHILRSPATEAVLAHLPMPRLDANTSVQWRVMSNHTHSRSHSHSHSDVAHMCSAAHQPHMIPTDALFGGRSRACSSDGHYVNSEMPHSPYAQQQATMRAHHHSTDIPRVHTHSQSQNVYQANNFHSSASSSSMVEMSQSSGPRAPTANGAYDYDLYNSVPPANGASHSTPTATATNGNPGASPSGVLTSPTGSLTGIPIGNPSQFDLNWPSSEVDGLAQMLADDHTLDGDFWMSLPNLTVPWQSWPQSVGGGGGGRRESDGMNGPSAGTMS